MAEERERFARLLTNGRRQYTIERQELRGEKGVHNSSTLSSRQRPGRASANASSAIRDNIDAATVVREHWQAGLYRAAHLELPAGQQCPVLSEDFNLKSRNFLTPVLAAYDAPTQRAMASAISSS